MRAKIIRGRCEDVLVNLPSESVDLVLFDPPSGETQNDWDAELDYKALWFGLDGVVKDRANVVILASSLRFAYKLLFSNLQHPTNLQYRYDLIWEKNKATGHLNAKKMPMRVHEYALVFYKRLGTYNPQKTDGHKPMNYARRTSHGSGYGEMTRVTESEAGTTRRYPRSVQRFDIVNNDSPERTHPSQKPVPWLRWLVETYSNPGDTVLDACAGSGATGDACALAPTRDVILIERDAGMVTKLKTRFAWCDWDQAEVDRELAK